MAWGGTALETRHWSGLTVANNVLASTGKVVDFVESSGAGYTWARNTHYRDPAASAWAVAGSATTWSSWRSKTGLGGTDQVSGGLPSTPSVFVRPNPRQAGRGHVIVYNWPQSSTVQADLSAILRAGQAFTIHSVQDLWGRPLVSGTYGGGTVSLPMTAGPPPVVGGSTTPPLRTTPAFDVFLVRTQ